MREAFTVWEPKTDVTRGLLGASIRVIREYTEQGYQLTLRQLYYQLVARDLIPNQQRWYNRLGDVVSKGRLAGYIDWNSIVDRGRVPIMPADWPDPASILKTAASSYRLDRWMDQPNLVEVWCEKDALSSVLEPVCRRYHVRFLANRGYSSSTAIYDAAKRFDRAAEDGRLVVVIYLGDHDPSGLDMSRDIADRLHLMSRSVVEVERLALNYPQIQLYQPPPNPTKLTDSRAGGYIARYGYESWELDALEPRVLDQLVEHAIVSRLDRGAYDRAINQEDSDRALIRQAAASIRAGRGDP